MRSLWVGLKQGTLGIYTAATLFWRDHRRGKGGKVGRKEGSRRGRPRKANDALVTACFSFSQLLVFTAFSSPSLPGLPLSYGCATARSLPPPTSLHSNGFARIHTHTHTQRQAKQAKNKTHTSNLHAYESRPGVPNPRTMYLSI